MPFSRAASSDRSTGWVLMSIEPSAWIDSTICGVGFWFWSLFSTGTWMSRTLRAIGSVIMKITRSTSSTSMNGVMLMFEFSPALGAVMDMGPSPRAFLGHGRLGAEPLLGHGAHHPDAGLAGHLHRLLDLRHLQLVVRLQVQD